MNTTSTYFKICFFSLITTLFIHHKAIGQSDKKTLKKIPASAVYISTTDGKSISNSVDFNQIRNLELYKFLDENFSLMMKEKYETASKIYKDPAAIGLDLENKMYHFIYLNPGFNPSNGVIIPMKSAKKFEQYLKNAFKEDFSKNAIKVKGYKYIPLDRNGAVAYSNKALIFINAYGPQDYFDLEQDPMMEEFKKIIKNKKKNSILTNDNFRKGQTTNFHQSYWINFSYIFKDVSEMAKAMPELDSLNLLNDNLFKNSYSTSYLNFNKGEIAFNTETTLSPELQTLTQKMYGKSANTELLKYFNKDLLGIFSYSLNTQGIRSMVDDYIGEYREDIKIKISEEIFERSITEDSLIKQMNLELDSIHKKIYPPYDYSDYDYGYDYSDTTYADTSSYDYNYDYLEENSYEENSEEYKEEEGSDDSIYNEEGNGHYGDDSNEAEPTYEEPEYNQDTNDSDKTETHEEYNYEQNTDLVEDAIVDTVAYGDYYDEYDYSGYDTTYYTLTARKDTLLQLIKERKKLLARERMKSLPFEEDDFWNLFEGDMIAGITDFYMKEEKYIAFDYDEDLMPIEVEKTRKVPYPEFVVTATVKETKSFQKFIDYLLNKNLIAPKEGYYQVVPGTESIYLSISDNIFILTNNDELVTKYLKGYPEDSRVADAILNGVKNNSSFMFIDLKKILNAVPTESIPVYGTQILNICSNNLIGVSAQSNYTRTEASTSEFKIEFANKIDNSLFEVFRLINEVYLINAPKH